MSQPAVWLLCACVSLAACRKDAPAPSPSQPSAAGGRTTYDAPRRPTPPGAVEPPALPEDPVTGKLAEQQWREHMEREEEERQMLFDRQRLREHRALVRLITTLRTRYDRAKTEPALGKLREGAAQKLEDIQKRVAAIDPDRVNSRLLGDYEALQSSLRNDYPDARAAALRGDHAPLTAARATFDQRLERIDAWLEEAERGEEEK
jgi:hypothetical protein